MIISAADYREVRVALVAKGTGHHVDVHLFAKRAAGSTDDAFLADAISLTQSSAAGTDTGTGSDSDC